MRKYAFTLAEVLITLAIIGIVAAITIPSIVASHQKRELETQFAKTYRTLEQVISLAIAEHGDLSTWEWKDSYTAQEKDVFIKKYFLPYFNTMKFCSAGRTKSECFPIVHKYMSGLGWDNEDVSKQNPQVILADGTSINFALFGNYSAHKRVMSFDVDLNGIKKPNELGKDLFGFNLFATTGEFAPQGSIPNGAVCDNPSKPCNRYTYEQILNNCKAGAAWACAARVVAEGFKMNYY